MGLVDGKEALVTGAARGQGRSHAVRLASEGADMIAVDICANPLETLSYELSTEADLDETIKEIEATGRRAVKAIADVRSLPEFSRRSMPAWRARAGSTSSARTPASARGPSAGR